MTGFLIGILGLGAAAALAFAGDERIPARRFGRIAPFVSALALLSLVPIAREAVGVLASGTVLDLSLPWNLPAARFHLGLDRLSALFVLPVLAVAATSTLYGLGYMAAPHEAGRAGRAFGMTTLLVVSMLVLLASRNAVLFLIAWEMMSITGYFLVTLDDDHEGTRAAGLTFLIAMHAATFALVLMFGQISRHAGGSLEFEALAGAGIGAHACASVVLGLAFVGFGIKAGFFPGHLWLPGAHAAAPSHVSALMSGVLIKTAVYGLLRVFSFFAVLPAWVGSALLAIGILSGLYGMLFALAEHDGKRLLAYCSVENVGVVSIGLGLGFVCLAHGHLQAALLGFSGGLLHIWNHALFKPLLFLAFGATVQATGTRNLERLGGLAHSMPLTAGAALVGAAGISGLPFLNGFASEFLIFLGALSVAASPLPGSPIAAILAAPALALISGLAAACFVKFFGSLFLGAPRSKLESRPADPAETMLLPMAVLASACATIGLLSPYFLSVLLPVSAGLARLEPDAAWTVLGNGFLRQVSGISIVAGAFSLFLALLAAYRFRVLRTPEAVRVPTWDCGYAIPNARMQYTPSSFSSLLTSLFAAPLQIERREQAPPGDFPKRGAFHSLARDLVLERLVTPSLARLRRFIAPFHDPVHSTVGRGLLHTFLFLILLLVVQAYLR